MNLTPPLIPVSTGPRFRKALAICFSLYVFSLVTSMSGMEIFSTVLIIGLSGIYFSQKRWPGLPEFWKPLLAFVVVAVIGILLDDAPIREKLYSISRMRFFLIYAFLFFYLRDFKKDEGWLKVLLVTTSVVGVYGFFQHFISFDLLRPVGKKVLLFAIQDEKIGPLVVGTFNHHLTFSNVYSFYACLFTSVGLFFLPRKWWFLVMGAWTYLLCFWTESRAAWVAIPVTLFLITAVRSRKAFFLAVGIAALGAFLFFKTDVGFQQRLDRTFVKKDGLYHLGARARLWSAQIEMFKEHPWFGIGFNNNERKAKEYVDRLFPADIANNFYGHAHSAFLQVLASMGILGVLAYGWIWVSIFKSCFESLRAYGRTKLEYWICLGALAGFVGFQIQGVTQWNFGDAEVLHNVIFFWAIIAALHVRAFGQTSSLNPVTQ
jgi:putative inorganic carbon (HCO3(-)) transporter